MNLLTLQLQTGLGATTPADQMGDQGLLVYFMREFACHQCQGHVAKLVQAHDLLAKNGINILVIGGGHAKGADKLTHRFQAPFTIAADPERQAYKAFGLDKAMGFWQKSGSFLLTPQGEIVYELRSTMPNGLNLDELTEALESRLTASV